MPSLGAAGFWYIDAWMGLEPLVFLRDAVGSGDIEAARECIGDTMFKRGDPTALHWREAGYKIAVRFAGYCDPGPLRPRFLEIPEDVLARQKARADTGGAYVRNTVLSRDTKAVG